MAESSINLSFHGRVRMVIDGPHLPLAERFVRQLFYSFVTDQLQGVPDIRVHFGPLPVQPPAPGDFQWGWQHKLVARYSARLSGLTAGPIEVYVDANRYGAMFFTGRILSMLLYEMFLRQGFATVHAACVTKGSRTVLLPGEQGTGKTLLAMVFLHRGYRLLGDDRVFLGPGGEVLGIHLPLTLRYGCGVEQVVQLSAKQRVQMKLRQLFGQMTLGFYQLMTIVPAEELFPGSTVVRSQLTAVCQLVSGDAFADQGAVSPEIMLDLLAGIERLTNPGVVDKWVSVDAGKSLADYWQQYGLRYRTALAAALGHVNCRQALVPRRFTPEGFGRVADLCQTMPQHDQALVHSAAHAAADATSQDLRPLPGAAQQQPALVKPAN